VIQFFISAIAFQGREKLDVAFYVESQTGYDDAFDAAERHISSLYPRCETEIISIERLSDRYIV